VRRRHLPKDWVTPKTRHSRLVVVLEIWSPDGRHYLRYPDGLEFDVPRLEPLRADDYIIFSAGL
jgi:hypothetical protein